MQLPTSRNAFPLTGLKLEPESAATKKALEDSIAGRANSTGRPSSGGMGGGGGAGEIGYMSLQGSAEVKA